MRDTETEEAQGQLGSAVQPQAELEAKEASTSIRGWEGAQAQLTSPMQPQTLSGSGLNSGAMNLGAAQAQFGSDWQEQALRRPRTLAGTRALAGAQPQTG